MRIGIRAHDLNKQPIQELVKEIKEKGFDCTQLALNKAIHEFNTTPEAMTPGLAMYLKQLFNQHQVDIAVLGCYLNLANPNPEQLDRIFKTYEAHIRFASIVGCGVVGTETGAVNETYTFEESNHSEEALNIFIHNLKRVVAYAEKMGVIIGIEPVYVHIVHTIERAKRVLSAVASPNLQIILDPVNLLSLDNYMNQDVILEDAFELLGKDIAVIHAKDYRIEDGRVKAIPCGQGLFDFHKLLTLLKIQKPHIHVLLENTSSVNAVQTKEFLETIYRNIEIE